MATPLATLPSSEAAVKSTALTSPLSPFAESFVPAAAAQHEETPSPIKRKPSPLAKVFVPAAASQHQETPKRKPSPLAAIFIPVAARQDKQMPAAPAAPKSKPSPLAKIFIPAALRNYGGWSAKRTPSPLAEEFVPRQRRWRAFMVLRRIARSGLIRDVRMKFREAYRAHFDKDHVGHAGKWTLWAADEGSGCAARMLFDSWRQSFNCRFNIASLPTAKANRRTLPPDPIGTYRAKGTNQLRSAPGDKEAAARGKQAGGGSWAECRLRRAWLL